MAKKTKRSAREKRVLIGSMALAAVIGAGSTFAWFTSQDEVTNRLSARADYGVSITETFTPPSDWVPGQVVNKDVYTVNTGNVAAFVKAEVKNSLNIKKEASATAAPSADSTNYVELNNDKVISLQAGAVIAYSPVADEIGNSTVDIAGGDKNFTPTETGIYIFRREITPASGTTAATYEYAGYYFVKGATAAENKFFKIEISGFNGDFIDPATGVVKKDEASLAAAATALGTSVKYKTFTESVVTPEIKLDSTNNRLVATYAGGEGTDDDVVIYINLANIGDGTAANKWQADETNFYYTSILAPGNTSAMLIDSVELSEDTKNGAYMNFDYDLTIAMNSAQAVYAEDGSVLATAVEGFGKTATPNADGTVVKWAAAATPTT